MKKRIEELSKEEISDICNKYKSCIDCPLRMYSNDYGIFVCGCLSSINARKEIEVIE